MSQPEHTAFGYQPKVGEPTDLSLEWTALVTLIIEVTVAAYQNMVKKSQVQADWEENTFTVQLAKYLRQTLQARSLIFLAIFPFASVITPDIEAGVNKVLEAAEIDLKIAPTWADYENLYFAWECKRIAPKGISKNYDNLVPEYIAHGIKRFVRQEYSKDLADAGMIGYMLAGNVPDVVSAINDSMTDARSQQGMSQRDYLKPSLAVGTFNHIYHSQHIRASTNAQPIQLHHLFLTFGF